MDSLELSANPREPDSTRPEHLRNVTNGYLRNDVLSQTVSATENPINPTTPYQYSAVPLQLDVEFDPAPYLAREVLNWHLLKLGAFVTLFHDEVKRPISRRMATSKGLFNHLLIGLEEECNCAAKQVDVIFPTKYIISIASAGEFWKFRISISSPDASTHNELRVIPAATDTVSNQSKPMRRELARNALPSQWFSAPETSPTTSTDSLLSAPSAQSKAPISSRGSRSARARRNPKTTSFMDYPELEDPEDEKNDQEEGHILDPVAEEDGEDEVVEQGSAWEDEKWIDEENWATRTRSSSVASDFEEGDRSFNLFGDGEGESEGCGEALEPESNDSLADAGVKRGRTRYKRSEHSTRYLQPVTEGTRKKLEIFVWKLRDALPELGEWSDPILFGTPASNQRFYMIRELLRNEIKDLEFRYSYGLAPKVVVQETKKDVLVANAVPQATQGAPAPNNVSQA
ncbi:hypothetical protein H1R20_g212, partial [Candolleomyces eurysporus]